MKELQEKLAHWAIGVGLGVGLLVLLNRLQIPYYLYYPRTTQTVLISESYDYYLFLISSVSVPWTFAVSWKRFARTVSIGTLSVWVAALVLAILNQSLAIPILYATVISATALSLLRTDARRSVVMEILPSTLSIFALVESASLFFWIAAALNPRGGLGMASQQLEVNLTFSPYPLAILMFLLLLFSWLWIPLIPRLTRAKGHLVVRYQPSPKKPSIRAIAAALDLFAIIAIIVFFYSYLAGQTWVVGVDSHLRYIDPLNSFFGLTPSQALQTSEMHVAYVGFLYLIQLATGLSPFAIVKYAPLVLAFLTASTVFFATLRGGWNFQLATLTAICTLLWLPTTLGIYAGIQSNWVAVLFWMIFLLVYFANSEPKITTYIILAVLSMIILIVHPWTWGVFAATLLLTAAISRQTAWTKHCLRTLAAALLLALPAGIVSYLLFQNVRNDIANAVNLYLSSPASPFSLLNFGGALVELFSSWGPFVPPILLLLSLVGAYSLSRRRGITTNYLIAWIATWCVGSILVAPLGYNPTNVGASESGLWRMLYVSPLPFLLALGLEKCVSLSKRTIASGGSQNISSRAVPVLSFVPFVALGGVLFVIWDPNIRLLLVASALVLALVLTAMLPSYQTVDVLIVSVLILVLLNAALRSLFPLLLDPHNLFGTLGR